MENIGKIITVNLKQSKGRDQICNSRYFEAVLQAPHETC